MSKAVDNTLTTELNEILESVFQPFEINARQVGSWLTFPNSRVQIQARVSGGGRTDENLVAVQIDICIKVDEHRTMIQSFPGVGRNEDESIVNAFENFFAHSLHLILATFFRKGEDEVTLEGWNIAEIPRKVIFSHAIRKGNVPESLTNGEFPWFSELEERLKALELPPGIHWVEMHFAQVDGDMLLCDVRLDNEEWQPAQMDIAFLGWPPGESFYSIRMFLTIQDL